MIIYLLFLESERPNRGRSFRGYSRGGRDRGRRGNQYRPRGSYPHPRSHLADDDDDIDMDSAAGGGRRSDSRL